MGLDGIGYDKSQTASLQQRSTLRRLFLLEPLQSRTTKNYQMATGSKLPPGGDTGVLRSHFSALRQVTRKKLHFPHKNEGDVHKH